MAMKLSSGPKKRGRGMRERSMRHLRAVQQSLAEGVASLPGEVVQHRYQPVSRQVRR
jgi:hypothetical protein